MSDMDLVEQFRALHQSGDILLMPNAWDIGSARILAHLGFRALATSSGGAAAARGLLDGDLDPPLTFESCAEVAAAVDVPVSADLEDGFADDADGVAETIRTACTLGLAGASIEDWTDGSVLDTDRAAERVAAAVDAAAGRLVITARADNHFHGVDDLADTVRRLQAYQDAGADVLYAPGLTTREQIRTVLGEIDRPLNVLTVPGAPPVDELAALGVRRISTGASSAFAAYAALGDLGRELLTAGTYGYTSAAGRGRTLVREAFGR